MEQIMKQFDYCVFDLETTGMKPEEGAKIIEIGAVCLEAGEIRDSFHQLVDPGESLDPEITELTGITDRDLRGSPRYEEVLPRFREFTGDRYLVAHNADFDMSFLRTYGGGQFGRGVIDTLKLARTVVNLRSNRLENLARVFDVELENAHRADEDAEATARVFRQLWPRMRLRSHYEKSDMPPEIMEQAPDPLWKRIFSWFTG